MVAFVRAFCVFVRMRCLPIEVNCRRLSVMYMWRIGCRDGHGLFSPVFCGGETALAFEEFGEGGLVGEVEAVGEYLYGVVCVFEELEYFPGEGGADPFVHSFVGYVFDDAV